jgi:predicted Ser/Thr protein kinase
MTGPTRSSLSGTPRRVLQAGRGTSADVLLVSTREGPTVIKDYASRPNWVRRTLGRWSLAREERAYRRLEGVEFVPRYLGRVDADAIAIEYRPGVLLSRSLAGRLPETFLLELESAISAIHREGVVHLDLRHRTNVLAGDDGHPVLLDFASALFFDPARVSGRFGRALFAWIDRRALRKWQVRLGG